jgi:predicted nuclease of predicted toxin-antitoxin system
VKMRILADENFPGIAVNELRKRGHNVVWVRTAKPGIGDLAILEWAQTEDRLLVTLDKDFGELAIALGSKTETITIAAPPITKMNITAQDLSLIADDKYSNSVRNLTSDFLSSDL